LGILSESVNDPGGDDDLQTVEMLILDASAATDDGNFRGALEGFRWALELTQQIFGEDVELAECRRSISDIYKQLGDLSSAVSELSGATRTFESILGTEHPSAISSRRSLEQLIQSSQK